MRGIVGRPALLVAVAAVALVAGLLSPLPTKAAAIAVTTTTDELAANGACSLREAILAANRDQQVDSCRTGRGKDTIKLMPGNYQLSIEGIREDDGLTGDLDIAGSLSIAGSGIGVTSITGDTTDRVLDVHGAITVSISEIAIVGIADLHNPEIPDVVHGNGGGIRSTDASLSILRANIAGTSAGHPNCQVCFSGEGGAIFAERGALSIRDSTLTGRVGSFGGVVGTAFARVDMSNVDISGSAVEGGSAIAFFGSSATIDHAVIYDSTGRGAAVLTGGGPDSVTLITDSVIRDNSAGGIANVPGGVLTIVDSAITGNDTFNAFMGDSGHAAGISNGGTASLIRVSVSDNESVFGIGGIRNHGTMTVRDSVVARNTSLADTGGIFSSSVEGLPASSLALVNSTVSGNTGGGVGGADLASGTIQSSSIVGNSSASASVRLGSVSMANTVLGDNTGSEVSPDCEGSFVSLGYNLVEDGSACASTGNTSLDIAGADPMLGALTDNGGTTLSHMPLQGSPLIDAGNPARPSDSGAACPRFDQIGTRRPQDGDAARGAICDIGAIERPASR